MKVERAGAGIQPHDLQQFSRTEPFEPTFEYRILWHVKNSLEYQAQRILNAAMELH
jgi:hypothetical protein